jgi:hypothetical protein
VLVVIGILIALQINTWNQERLNQHRVDGYLKSLAEDLKSDIAQYDSNIEYYKQDLENNKRILANDEFKALETDSIAKLAMSYYQLNRSSRYTYEGMKNAGLIESLGTNSISKALSDYYNLELTYYQGLLQWDKEGNDSDREFWAYDSNFEYGSMRNDGTNSLPFKDDPATRKDNLIKLIESTKGRNHIRNAIVRHEHALIKVQGIRSTAQNLLNSILAEVDEE